MNKENCALKLVDKIILYYDARSKKHQIAFNMIRYLLTAVGFPPGGSGILILFLQIKTRSQILHVLPQGDMRWSRQGLRVPQS